MGVVKMKGNEIMAVSLLLILGMWAVSTAASSPSTGALPSDINCASGDACDIGELNSAPSEGYGTTSSGEKTVSLSYSNGYYVPREITVNQGDKVRIEFDQSKFVGCMTTFNIYDLGIKAYVPNTPYIEFVADKPGVFRTGCNMGMGDGRFIVQPSEGKKLEAAAEPAPLPSTVGSCGGPSGGCGCGG